jgi:hypothetical protein
MEAIFSKGSCVGRRTQSSQVFVSVNTVRECDVVQDLGVRLANFESATGIRRPRLLEIAPDRQPGRRPVRPVRIGLDC